MSRAWLNLVLLLLLAGLGSLVYFEPGLEQPQKIVLTSLNPSQVNTLRLERVGEKPLQLERENEQWLLRSPVEIEANVFRLQQLLEVLTATSIQRYPVADLDLSKYGLDRPQVRLFVDGLEIAFGQLDPLNYRRYVLLDDVMHLIPHTDMALMTDTWAAFVSPRLLPADIEIKEIELPALGKIIREQSGWRYQGDAEPTSADAIQTLIDAWRRGAALRVDMADTLSASQGEVVRLAFSNNTELLLRLIRQEGEVVLIRDDLGLAYQLGGSQAMRLLQWSEPAAVEAATEN